MRLEFTKMHGLGNDFVLIDAVRKPVTLSPAQIRRLAHRHFGVGCDQVLVVELPVREGTDFRYRIFNADGSEAGACGNGARCFARFVHARGLSDKRALVLDTLGGLVRTTLLPDDQVEVDMGVPCFEPAEIPFHAPADATTHILEIAAPMADQMADRGDQTVAEKVEISALALGNPHAVLLVEDVETAPVSRLGPLIERHERFPQGVNVGFLQVVDPGQGRLRVHERGSGETLACGSGACAAVVAGVRRGLFRRGAPVTIALRGGELRITWPGEGHSVMMTGPAAFVFEGTIEL